MKYLHRLVSLVPVLACAGLVACASGAQTRRIGHLNDTLITAEVKAAFGEYSSLDATQINVETLRGRVQLRGFVEEREEVLKAAEVAGGVTGVRAVMNDLLIK